MQTTGFSLIQIIGAIVTILVVVYGAVLSTYNFRNSRKRDKPSLKIAISFGKVAGQGMITRPEQDKSLPYLIVSISNSGFRPVTIDTPYFIKPDKSTIVPPAPYSDVTGGFPHTLEESKGCMIWGEALAIAGYLKQDRYSGIVKLSAAVRDKVGKQYQSEPIDFDIDKCLT